MSDAIKNRGLDKTHINWFPGHMAKTKREIKENIKLIDLVYDVIDARMPISSRVIDLGEYILDKPKITIVTKYDLCDKEKTDKILKTFNNTIIKCDLLNGNIKEILSKTKEFQDELNNKRKEKGLMPTKIRVLVVGAPNVGKSTLINRLVGRKSQATGNKPGVTKKLNWIRINKDIELLDSPGILYPKIENQETAHILAALSSIKEEILDIEIISKFIIKKLIELYPNTLKERYKLDSIDEETIIDDIAKNRGFFEKGGLIDYERVYKTIIQDLKNGNIKNITLDTL